MQRRWPAVYQRVAAGGRRRMRGRCGRGASAGRERGGGDAAAAGHHTPIARGTCDAAPRIIASFIKFSGTKLREFLIENKLRRDSLIWISILRIKCGFMFSFRCFFSLCYAKHCSTLFRYYNTLYFWVKDSFEVKLSCINYFIFTVLF